MLDQGDVSLFMWVLDATELLSHREKVGRHLTGVHQQHGSVNTWICTLRVRGLSFCGWKTQMPWHSLLKKNKLLFRSDELIRSDTLSLKHYSHVLARGQRCKWSNKKKHSTLVNSVVRIYMVLEHWLVVMRPCSSLTSLWKEIPVKEAKKGNFIFKQFLRVFKKTGWQETSFICGGMSQLTVSTTLSYARAEVITEALSLAQTQKAQVFKMDWNSHKCLVFLR